MAEVVYVPVTQQMTEIALREFQAQLDALATDRSWEGTFVVMRCRPAKPLPATGGSPQ